MSLITQQGSTRTQGGGIGSLGTSLSRQTGTTGNTSHETGLTGSTRSTDQSAVSRGAPPQHVVGSTVGGQRSSPGYEVPKVDPGVRRKLNLSESSVSSRGSGVGVGGEGVTGGGGGTPTISHRSSGSSGNSGGNSGTATTPMKEQQSGLVCAQVISFGGGGGGGELLNIWVLYPFSVGRCLIVNYKLIQCHRNTIILPYC